MSERGDNQRAFDAMLAHLRQQGRRSLSTDGVMCAYRGHNGLKCAVGALMSDELYDLDFEGAAANTSTVVHAVRNSGYPLVDGGFLASAQDTLHDGAPGADYLTELEEAAQDFASDWGLTYAHPVGP